MKNILLVFIGGGLGSVVRYLLARLMQISGGFPIGILIVNVLASFIVGIVVGRYINNETIKMLVMIGFCGGFSTFSAFSNDTLQFMLADKIGEAFLNIILNVLLCIGATFGGMYLMK